MDRLKRVFIVLLCLSMVGNGFSLYHAKQVQADGFNVENIPASKSWMWDSIGYYENEPEIYVGLSGVSLFGNQQAALQFDLSRLQNVNVINAKLKVHITEKHYFETLPYVSLYGLENDNWSPQQFPLQSTDQIITFQDTNIQEGEWKEFDVTGFVANQLTKDKLVSFGLLGNDQNSGSEFVFSNSAYRPQLTVETEPIQASASTPLVTNAVTIEDEQTSNGLEITPNSDDNNVEYYKITQITGGRLYQNEGSIEITDGTFITRAEGEKGLKFTPNPNANTPSGEAFSFTVQASFDNTGTGLSNPMHAKITVSEVNDSPNARDDNLTSIYHNSGELKIPFSKLLENDTTGPENESSQALTLTKVENPIGGTVKIEGTDVVFTPTQDFTGQASFDYTIKDNGTSASLLDPQTSEANVSFLVEAPQIPMPSIDWKVGSSIGYVGGIVSIPVSFNNLSAEMGAYGLQLEFDPNILEVVEITPTNEDGFFSFPDNDLGWLMTAWADPNGGDTPITNTGNETLFTINFKIKETAAIGETPITINPDPSVTNATDIEDRDITTGNIFNGKITIQERILSDNTTISSDFYTIDNQTETIKNVPVNIDVSTFKSQITAAEKATLEVYESDASTIKTGNMKSSDIVVVTAEDGTTKKTYTVTVATVDPLTQLNAAKSAENADDLFATLLNPELAINFPQGFENWTKDKKDLLTENVMYSIEGNYSTKNQVQYIVDMVDKALTVYDKMDLQKMKENIDSFFVHLTHASEYFPSDDQFEGITGLGTSYANMSEVDKQIYAYETKFYFIRGSVAVNQRLESLKATLSTFKPINSVLDKIDMNNVLVNLSLLQKESQNYNSTFPAVQMDAFPLDLAKAENISYPTQQDLAQWMLSKRSALGYANFQQIQEQFNRFFAPEVPNVTPAETAEDSQSLGGLVITPDDLDTSVTHFKISEVTGGTLNKNDGTTTINNGSYITVSEGEAGLKFTPAVNSNSVAGNTFSFKVQSSYDTNGLRESATTEAIITVTEVNDEPVAADDSLPDKKVNSPSITIPFEDLFNNDSKGPENENSQTLTITSVDNVVGGDAYIQDRYIIFTPSPNYLGLAMFGYTVKDNGTTNHADDFKTDFATARFNIVDTDKPTITLNGDENVYLIKGTQYLEPGFSAYDEVDQDLTNEVVITGSVNTEQLGIYHLKYNVSDNSGNEAMEVTRTVQVVSTDLNTLTVSSGDLMPIFQSHERSYTTHVPFNVQGMDVSAGALDATSSIAINGDPVGTSETKTIPLHVGSNIITIIVTAQGGSTKNYTVEVVRDLAKPAKPQVSANDVTNEMEGADSTMEFSTNGGDSWTTYNPLQAPRFSGTQTVWVRVKAVQGESYASDVTELVFTTNSSSQAPPTTPAPNTRQGDVGVGSSNDPTAKVDITRQTENNKKVDQVILDNKTTGDTVKKALEQKQDTVSIRISDLPNDLADEVSVKVPKQSIGQLSNTKVALNIQTDDVTINLPKETVQGLDGKEDDLFFRVVPIRKADEKQKVVENTLKAEVVKEVAGDRDVQVFGKPMMIETNYQNQKTFVTFSLKDIELPADPTKQEEFAKTLAVYIQHSDGDEEVQKGNIKYDASGKPVGIEIEITKFSTFTIIGLPNTAPTASKVAISGKQSIGEILKGSYTYTDKENDKQATSKFKWYRADDSKGKNKKAIAGATKSTYKLTTADKGKYIIFEVTPVAKTGETTGKATTSTSIGPVKEVTKAINTAPVANNVKITGKAQVGSTVKATYTYSDADKDAQGTSEIQWYRADSSKGKNKKAIKGAMKSTYKLTTADKGKYISFTVTPVAKSGVKTGKATASSYIGQVKQVNTAPVAKNVKITGKVQVGNTLKATYSYQDADKDAQGKSVFKWYSVDTKTKKKRVIKGATKTTYKVATKDIGKQISFEVTPIAKTGVTKGKAASTKTATIQAEYTGHLDLGAIKSKTYTDFLATIIKNNYNGKINIKKKGSYYYLSVDFIDKKRAQEVGRDMKKKKLIINYYVK